MRDRHTKATPFYTPNHRYFSLFPSVLIYLRRNLPLASLLLTYSIGFLPGKHRTQQVVLYPGFSLHSCASNMSVNITTIFHIIVSSSSSFSLLLLYTLVFCHHHLPSLSNITNGNHTGTFKSQKT